jgi:hypothetical protein
MKTTDISFSIEYGKKLPDLTLPTFKVWLKGECVYVAKDERDMYLFAAQLKYNKMDDK